MIADIDRTTVMSVIELADAVKAAEALRAAARRGPASRTVSLDGPDLVPPKMSAAEQLLHDHLGGLDDHAMARVLALYWLGRQAAWEPVDAEFYRVMLAQAEANLEDTPWYLTMKPNLGGTLRAGMAILGG